MAHLKADPEDNAGVLLAYETGGLFNRVGSVWVCWGDLRTGADARAGCACPAPKVSTAVPQVSPL